MLVSNFWRDKRVLITGHTGFKGAWLTLWLHRMGAEIFGVAEAPKTSPSLFDEMRLDDLCSSYFCDIRDLHKMRDIALTVSPDIVFHLAAQPLVREGYRSPIETFSTNVMGTANVLEAVRGASTTKVAIMATTDKVYKNFEWPWPYRENDMLGGHDPYSASKAASELVIDSYVASFFDDREVSISTVRAGNVIGGGDWSDDRLLPDAIRAWQTGGSVNIRRPYAIRPWQHVLEPLAGYLILAEKTWSNPSLAGPYNFGPDPINGSSKVRDVIEFAQSEYGSGGVLYEDGGDGPHEAGMLALDVSKAKCDLNVHSKWGLEKSISRTVRWYVAHSRGACAKDLCYADIDEYEKG